MPNLQDLPMKLDLTHDDVRVESGRDSGVQEGDESTALLGQDLDAFDGTESNLAEQLIN